MSTKNRKIWAAGILLILTVAAAIGFLFRLSQPDQEQRSVYLNCTESDRGGWVFFTEAGPVEPVFGFGGYINGIPAEGTGPVAAERVMEEPGARHFLQFDSYGAGLQVFLDHTLLYTDFPAEENPVDSFLEDVDPASISHDGLRVPLPEDCGGKRLRIVTYGPSMAFASRYCPRWWDAFPTPWYRPPASSGPWRQSRRSFCWRSVCYWCCCLAHTMASFSGSCCL